MTGNTVGVADIHAAMNRIAALLPDPGEAIPRHIRLNPETITDLAARYSTPPTRPPWLGSTIGTPALLGLTVIGDTRIPASHYQITDDHGCIITDSRSGHTLRELLP